MLRYDPTLCNCSAAVGGRLGSGVSRLRRAQNGVIDPMPPSGSAKSSLVPGLEPQADVVATLRTGRIFAKGEMFGRVGHGRQAAVCELAAGRRKTADQVSNELGDDSNDWACSPAQPRTSPSRGRPMAFGNRMISAREMSSAIGLSSSRRVCDPDRPIVS